MFARTRTWRLNRSSLEGPSIVPDPAVFIAGTSPIRCGKIRVSSTIATFYVPELSKMLLHLSLSSAGDLAQSDPIERGQRNHEEQVRGGFAHMLTDDP
jgi:hypothetical protein